MIHPTRHHRSRPTTHTHVEHRTHRARPAACPDALPARYTPLASTPVDGVAIIGCQLNRTPDEREAELANVIAMLETVEPVSPLRPCDSPSSEEELDASDQCTLATSPDSFRLLSPTSSVHCAAPSPHDDTIAPRPDDENHPDTTCSPGVPTSVPRQDASSADDQPFSRSLLNKGYILFSDDALARLKHPHFAALLQKYRDSHNTEEPTLQVDPLHTARQQRLAEACHYLSLGAGEFRPLFRRRAAEEVYGEAVYETAPTA